MKHFASLMLLCCATAFAQTPKASPPKSVRLYVLDCGRLDIPDTSAYRLKKEELKSSAMSAPCFFIAHPKGTLMWDTGPVSDTTFKDGVGTLRYAKTTKTLTSQLVKIGYAPSDVTYLALSHFHWDHVGNANLFAAATWLTPKSEHDYMFSDAAPQRTEPQNFSQLRYAKTTYITTPDYDVFGDGAVIIKAAPGHSPGHQVLAVKLAKSGTIVISGDLYHYPEERAKGLVPTTEFNPDQTAASRVTIEQYIKDTHAQFWIQHDMIGNAKLKKSPAYYD